MVQSTFKVIGEANGVITTGAHRVADIVRSLRNFARLDEAEFQAVDIHEGIENTLALMAHELCDEIRVVKEYGKVPEIYCFPAELNQVFMNLLSNAVQAIGSKGTIHIKTFSGNGQVDVQISDTGPGIKSNKIKKLFEFDFSQSSSRVKMATGLVTVKNIVEKHKGTIEVESKIGQGTTFILQLPIGKSL
ncbi:HAMP domain-containing histidine kinase [candidate division KSB1 bacterium]|nr:HAMP domain-containing histidine kinase [candidate division KSB1 bacterium]